MQIGIRRRVNAILTDRIGIVGDGGNSGFQAINLAVQFGAARVLLVDFDMRTDFGAHWHAKRVGLGDPSEMNVSSWRRILDAEAPRFGELGVKIINCSPISALTGYPVMSFAEAIRC